MSTNLVEVKHSLTKKLIINFLIICTLAGTILTALTYYRTKNYIWSLFSRITTSCSVSISHMFHDINAPIYDYINHKQMDLYESQLEILKDFAKSFNLKYLYVYIPDIKNNKIIPVFGIVGQTGEPIPNFKIGEPPENLELNDKVLNMFLTKQEKLTLEMNNEYGHVITGYSPIFDKDRTPIAIVGADIDFNYLMRRLLKDCSFFFVFIFIALSLLYLLGIYFIQLTFIKPILQLSTQMTQYFHHDIYEATPITLTTNDEINIIANLCNNMALEKKRIENELDIAKKIQLSSIPRVFPAFPERKDFDVFADITTAKEVGGDFYDFFFIDKDIFVFLIADVCGKGVPAALFMMEVKSVLKNHIKSGIPIDEAITSANKEICENNKQNFFVTVFFAVMDLTTGKISFVNAGHNYPLIKRVNGEFEYYKSENNLPLGIMDGFEYQKTEENLYNGDMIFLYTDGVTEAMNESEKLYGEENLKNTLNNNKNLNIQEVISEVENDVKRHSQNTEQSDDITTLIFRYNGNV